MSDKNKNYRLRSPDLSGPVPPPTLGRLPSYSRGSGDAGNPFSPRASVDYRTSFTPQPSAATSYFSPQTFQSPPPYAPKFPRTPSVSGFPTEQYQASPISYNPYSFNPPPRIPQAHEDPYYQHQEFSPYSDMARTRSQRNAEQQQPQAQPQPQIPPQLPTQVPFQHQQQQFEPSWEMNNAPPPVHHGFQYTAPPPQPFDHPPYQTYAPPPAQPTPAPEPTIDPALSIEVHTKFPVARIKRIMQADEDIGKVAQATPTAAAKALELFIITLVLKASGGAQAANSKRITAQHLKSAITEDKNFDFLIDTCADVPDEDKGGSSSTGGKKGRAKSEDVSDDDAGGAQPVKKKGRKRKESESSE